MKFTLICEHNDNHKVTHEFKNILLSDTLENIQNFLKGCGFIFDGTLDFVPDEEMFPQQTYMEKEYRNSDVDQDGRC